MYCEPLRLWLLQSSLRRIKGRRSSRGLLHVSIISTCCHQNNTIQYQLLPPACSLSPSTKCPSSGPQTAQSPLMSSSWPLLKCQEKKARWHPAPPPCLRLVNLMRRLMFSSRHPLERGRKPPKQFLAALTYLSLGESRSKPSNSVTWSLYHLLLLLSLLAFGPLLCTRRRLCSSSRWRCTGSSPGSVSRPPLVL